MGLPKMNNNVAMRNIFWDRIYEHARQDKNVMLVCADMGAPALDKFRRDMPDQYINVGIAEHSMVALAAGLTREGKNVYTYAIAPFATSRCHEFIKLNCGLMKLPIKIVGIGPGFGYEDSGPTHHTTEDISIMRPIPNLEIYSPCDSVCATAIADLTYKSGKPAYIRLDRQILPIIYKEGTDFTKGFEELKKSNGGTLIVSTGNMVHVAIEAANKITSEDLSPGIVDIYRIKPLNSEALTDVLFNYNRVITLEEHMLDGGLGSLIAETIMDNDIPVIQRRMGLRDYIYAYGGRKNIQKACGIDVDSVIKVIEQ